MTNTPLNPDASGCRFGPCDYKVIARGMCAKHYQRWRRHGDPHYQPNLVVCGPAEKRFWAHVKKADGCWGWDGSLSSRGYPQIKIDRKIVRAYRYSYELHYGPIEPGLEIDHMCRNTVCVNPEHLQMVTKSENLQNLSGANRNSSTGVRGVSWHPGKQKYVVQARSRGVSYRGGEFDSLEDAERAAIELRLRVQTNNLMDRKAS